MKRVLYLPFLIFILTGCQFSDETLPKKMPDDFAFSLKYGVALKNELNTYDHTYIKDLISNGTAETELTFTEEELLQTYDLFKDSNLFELSKAIGPLCKEPYDKYELKMTVNEQEHHLSWNTSCHAEELLEWEKVMKELHKEIIHKKPEYQQLPEASGGYL
ncbi:hypothetical protein ACI2JA_17050 [Alkalihalobacillus sp. NPDC078783]